MIDTALSQEAMPIKETSQVNNSSVLIHAYYLRFDIGIVSLTFGFGFK